MNIEKEVYDQIQRLKRNYMEPACILVSSDVMYEMQVEFASDLASYRPYYPYYASSTVEKATDTYMGLPVGVVQAGDDVKEYIKVGGVR